MVVEMDKIVTTSELQLYIECEIAYLYSSKAPGYGCLGSRVNGL